MAAKLPGKVMSLVTCALVAAPVAGLGAEDDLARMLKLTRESKSLPIWSEPGERALAPDEQKPEVDARLREYRDHKPHRE